MNEKEKLLNLGEALAEFVSKDAETADEYLKEEGIIFDDYAKDNLDVIRKKMSEYKLSKGQHQIDKYRIKYTKFQQKVKGKTSEQIQKLYPSLPQVAYNKFQDDNVNEDEIDDLLKDGSFLSFLDEELNDSQ